MILDNYVNVGLYNAKNFYFPYIQSQELQQTSTNPQMNNYEILGLIGQGAYGVVLKAKRKDTGSNVAIKKFKQTDDDELIKKTTGREIKVLRSLRHKNIVQLQQAFKKKGLVHLVFQYLDNNLLEVLEKNTSGLPNKQIAKYIYQVLEGLDYMHSLHYIHRDIKPENLLVNSEGLLKICDMGFAKAIQDQMTDYVATRWYRPIELLVGARYGPPIDIWAVGCILAQLSDTQPLFPGQNQVDQLQLILTSLGDIPDCFSAHLKANPIFKDMKVNGVAKNEESLDRYKSKLTQKGVDLLKKLLALDPEDRITASQALKHPYFDIIRPRRQRFQKTSQAWITSKKGSKVSLTQNYTDRNCRNSLATSIENSRSMQKQNILKNKISNVFFKFGQKKWNDSRIEDSNLYGGEAQHGMNKIYRKKQNDKKYMFPHQIGERRPQKFSTVVCNRTNVSFKITQKKRQKSTFFMHM